MLLLTTFVIVVFVYSLGSGRLDRTVVTPPMLFTAAGLALVLVPESLTELALDRPTLLLIAELGLVMTLFTDASRISLGQLRSEGGLAARLLSVGMLLTILLGAAAAMVVFGDLTWPEAGIVGAILAPTDAGLGQQIVSNRHVPARVREALNVEAGLNDGLSVPFLLLFIGLAAESGGQGRAAVTLARFLGEQLGYGTLLGLGIGLVGGACLEWARRREWMSAARAQLAVVTLPLLCVIAAEKTGASMFIAAFVCGLAVQIRFRSVARHSVEFAEDWGQLFNLFVFLLFGLLTARLLADFTLSTLLYAVLSLTLVRMVPVALALRGTGLSRPTALFMGWFGPRGLASIVLALVYVEQEVNVPGEATMRLAVMATVLLSIVAHGLTARPGIAAYARRVEALPAGSPERESA
jgi:NhaP-type Na+/H+ or K+/H+ antiporter